MQLLFYDHDIFSVLQLNVCCVYLLEYLPILTDILMSAATYLVMNKKSIYIDTYGKFVSVL